MTLPASNIAFLAGVDSSLARLGVLAEWIFHHDAPTAITKLRQFAEQIANSLAAHNGLPVDDRASFEEILRRLREDGRLPRQAGEVFHFLRRIGNAAVHLAAEAASARTLLCKLDQSTLSRAFRGGLVLQTRTIKPAVVLLERIKETQLVTMTCPGKLANLAEAKDKQLKFIGETWTS
ncbi:MULTISPECIES: DUF4145 domain-containing protein [unclassified Bradyrhizobium]|uniref:DUF4145 domain-containing protein n=1 Tax=unclassified Bradyrhizobium TaxID=2631580 RepID=UPI0028E75110|nr:MULTISPECIES: DUF4145 domain-containing protein [unclassified Bradyrhizobium]